MCIYKFHSEKDVSVIVLKSKYMKDLKIFFTVG